MIFVQPLNIMVFFLNKIGPGFVNSALTMFTVHLYEHDNPRRNNVTTGRVSLEKRP